MIETLPFKLLNVTEAGALAAYRWLGKGNKLAADEAAVRAMRKMLNQIEFAAEVALGEGEKDKSHGLYEGEQVGSLWQSDLQNADTELVIDPIEGTTYTAKGNGEVMSVLAVSTPNSFMRTKNFYMKKLASRVLMPSDMITWDPKEIVKYVASCLKRNITEVTVCLLDRLRHEEMIKSLREINCRIRLIEHCDVSACIATALGKIDIYMGTGGCTEGVLSAAAIKCLSGQFQAMLCNDKGEVSDQQVYGLEDLVKEEAALVATGVTDGILVSGIKGSETQSIIINRHGIYHISHQRPNL